MKLTYKIMAINILANKGLSSCSHSTNSDHRLLEDYNDYGDDDEEEAGDDGDDDDDDDDDGGGDEHHSA